jgi:hypothetical protein
MSQFATMVQSGIRFLGDLVQWIYGEDGMDGAFIEKQSIETFDLNYHEFEHNYCIVRT